MQSSKEQQGEIRKPSSAISANRGKQQNGKDQRSQENQTYQGNISCEDGHNKGQERLRTRVEAGDRGQDGGMASLTQWT